jgi:hypothetical protein
MYELNFDGQFAQIPQRMREALERYCVNKIKPGTFLSALIQNDLETAILSADQENLNLIKTYVLWFRTNTSGLFGKENFNKHLNHV